MKLNEPSALLPNLPTGARVLVVRLRSLGDLVLETPAIAALHDWRHDLKISALVEPWCAPALEGNPGISELILCRNAVADVIAIRQPRFSIVLNQHGGPRSAMLTALSRAPIRAGWRNFQFSFVYNVRVPDSPKFYATWDVHTVEHRISQLYWCGLPRMPIPRTRIYPQPDALASVSRLLAERGISPGDQYAVLQPCARLPGMRWPVRQYIRIAQYLRTAHGVASVLNLGPTDSQIADEVRREAISSAIVLDSINVRELIALIAGAGIFIGSDSGPGHIAAAVDCPCVILFGVTNPVQWRPWQGRHRVVDTGAKFKWIRGDKCILVSQSRKMEDIRFEEVRDACEELLRASQKISEDEAVNGSVTPFSARPAAAKKNTA